MKLLIGIFIFCLVLFIYVHIQFHLKTSEDLEMYEIDDVSKDKLEEICDIRQPVLFDFNNQSIIDTTCESRLLDQYYAFEVKIRNTMDTDTNTEFYVPFPLHSTIKLFEQDKQSCYFSENNADFLMDTGINKIIKQNDGFLRPYMLSNSNYDIMIGSNNTTTPFRYEVNYRNFFLVTQGTIQIKMTPPKNIKYLYPEYDYENFEFRSPINPWNPQEKYLADFNKIKCLEFTMGVGKILFLPAYWWYSIKFSSHSSVTCFRYRTYMNNLAIVPYISLYALQIQNIKRNVAKQMDISELQKDPIKPDPIKPDPIKTDIVKTDLVNTNVVNFVDTTIDNTI